MVGIVSVFEIDLGFFKGLERGIGVLMFMGIDIYKWEVCRWF